MSLTMLFTSALLSRHWDSSTANQECVIGRYSEVPLSVNAHQNKAGLMMQKRFKIWPQIRQITAMSGSIDSIDTNIIQKTLGLNILRFYKLKLWSLVKTKWQVGQRSLQKTWLQVDYLCTDGFSLEILPRCFVMQRQILMNVIIFVVGPWRVTE